MNTTDVDAEKYIKIFTFLDKETIEIWLKIIKQPSYEGFTKKLAEELTVFVHSKEDLEKTKASNISFEMQLKI
jgi:tyrosyl-tRNA synthetase